MNRIFINTKAIEKKLYWAVKRNTVFIIKNKNNIKILNVDLYIDDSNAYLFKKQKFALININKSKNIIIKNSNFENLTNNKKSFYQNLKDKNKIKIKIKQNKNYKNKVFK